MSNHLTAKVYANDLTAVQVCIGLLSASSALVIVSEQLCWPKAAHSPQVTANQSVGCTGSCRM